MRCRLQADPSLMATWCTRGKAVAPRCRPCSPPVDAVARMTARGGGKRPSYHHKFSSPSFGRLVVVWKAQADMLQRRGLLRVLGTSLLAAAAPRPQPTVAVPKGEVILTARGRIAATNDGDRALLDRDLLLAWGTDELRTTTLLTDGPSTFSGVLASRLLDGLGADGAQLLTRALNDYTVAIPIAELRALRSSWRWTATAAALGARARPALGDLPLEPAPRA